MLADEHKQMSFLGDSLEYAGSESGHYKMQAWWGNSFDKFIIKSEGEFTQENTHVDETKLLYGNAITPFWDTQLGVRADTRSDGKGRQWLAAGVQGLAPYWFELDAMLYIGTGGQSELNFNSEYDLHISQRLILQPRLDFSLRGKEDSVNALGSGLSNTALSLRLRYEFSRQFAPYLGVETKRHYGSTADLMRKKLHAIDETHYFLGLRFWF